jgi:hypothetical protein
MPIYLLDTSVVIDAINRKLGRWQLLEELVESGDSHEILLSGIADRAVAAHQR